MVAEKQKNPNHFWSKKEKAAFSRIIKQPNKSAEEIQIKFKNATGISRTFHAFVGRISRISTDRSLSDIETANRMLLNRAIHDNYKKTGKRPSVRGQLPASVERAEPQNDNNKPLARREGNLFGHKYRLRNGMVIEIKLPKNLSEVEAERIAIFIKTLPTTK
jgi:hypothetical protein